MDRGAKISGRGTSSAPKNRFEKLSSEVDLEHFDPLDEEPQPRKVATELLPDQAKTLIRENDSPDISFRYSINVYRGCEHGCAYCYARPSHETLGMNAGIDFETKILVKYDAPKLLREELNRRSWRGEEIVMSGVTDCYQPIERQLKLTRSLLEIMVEANQPTGIITKNALVARDVDLLAQLAAKNLVHVGISITSLDGELTRELEPRTSSPAAKLRAIEVLSSAGVPVNAMVSPIIPGLNDTEIPEILAAVKQAGARRASTILVRLPWAVAPIFEAWLRDHRPTMAEKILERIRSSRDGKLNDPRFGSRMHGSGEYAENIRRTFELFAKKLGLDAKLPPIDSSQFRPPKLPGSQQLLF